MGTTKAICEPTQVSKGKEVSQGKEAATKAISEPPKAPKEKEVSQGKEAGQLESPPTTKADPPPTAKEASKEREATKNKAPNLLLSLQLRLTPLHLLVARAL